MELELRGGAAFGFQEQQAFPELGVDPNWFSGGMAPQAQPQPQLYTNHSTTAAMPGMFAETCKICKGTAHGDKRRKPCPNPHCRNGRVWITPYTGQAYTYAPHEHRPFSTMQLSALSLGLL
eukprot:NODE_656_length_687_cov_66.723214_g647_i0.p1 GENE.NODE_656_length_687_cov_66.723214_g647_i0~~NODE_656_length_687_cov_66.723214_g647_i0.p1  ORF type:complete len:121 (-),score=21.78 NODE_656_length_687_cov_66.723214_g647_i0:263-625(-)